MGRAIEQLESGLTIGHAGLGLRSGSVGSVRQEVHDGDTIAVRALGNLGVRFLGVDAPEISFRLPGEKQFLQLSDEKWEQFLRDPFASDLPEFDPPLAGGLMDYLKEKVGPGAARNHHEHAKAAEDALEQEVQRDIEVLGQDTENFKFFLAFAHEVMDRYGRLLAFINRDQPSKTQPEPRPLTYNERLLKASMVSPYLIWPNINPFRKSGSVTLAVIQPGTAEEVADEDTALRRARDWVRESRSRKTGLFNAEDPLRLEPFEVRFLARREPPDRWVIDLSRDDDKLLPPQEYYRIKNVEDRLFIPEEYVPLFVEAGWKKG